MKRRNYLHSVASLPIFSLPSVSSSESNEEFEYKIHAMWHRGNEEGHINSRDFEYQDYNRWKSNLIRYCSRQGIGIVPALAEIDGVRLISVFKRKKGYIETLLYATEQDIDILYSTKYTNKVSFCHLDGDRVHIAVENLADVKNTIKERI